MKVNFDGLRKNGAHAYNRLVKRLNSHTHGDEVGNPDSEQGRLYVGYISEELEDLRACLGTLLALESDDGEFKALEIDLLEFAPSEEGEVGHG